MIALMRSEKQSLQGPMRVSSDHDAPALDQTDPCSLGSDARCALVKGGIMIVCHDELSLLSMEMSTGCVIHVSCRVVMGVSAVRQCRAEGRRKSGVGSFSLSCKL